MIKKLHILKSKLVLLVLMILISSVSFSQVTFTANPTDAQITTALTGTGLTISAPVLVSGSRSQQIATFTNGIAGAGLKIDKGVMFSTGNVTQNLTNKNSATFQSDNPSGNYSDPDLTAITGAARYNPAVYRFTVTLGLTTTAIRLSYQFASEEYPDFVGSVYNDAFGFFVTGPGITGTANMARLPTNNKVTTINNINAGVQGVFGSNDPSMDLAQSAFYINNGHTTTIAGNVSSSKNL